MLLCVTATSVAAAVGCTTTHPVGSVSQPPHEPSTVDAAASPDAAPVAMSKRDAATTPEEPLDEVMAPRVGTTATAPDR
jgi:hypothetical protein